MRKIFIFIAIGIILLTSTVSAMTFSKEKYIGKIFLPPMGYFEIVDATFHSGTPCTDKAYKNLNLYEKGLACFGNGNDAIYFHYRVANRDIMSKLGDKE